MTNSETHPRKEEWQLEIEELEDQSRRAFLDANVPHLNRVFSDELLVNSPIGRIHDKNATLDLLGKGIIRHTSMVQHIEAMRRHGDLVVVMGRDVVTDPPDNVPVERRFTNIWRAAEGSWQLVARHAYPIHPTP